MEELIQEVREDYQIPPYYPDSGIKRLIEEAQDYLDSLNYGCDYQTDITYRSLIKTYCYYSYHHKIDEFIKNYQSMMLTWQLESEVLADATT